jgi:hypothetical protein
MIACESGACATEFPSLFRGPIVAVFWHWSRTPPPIEARLARRDCLIHRRQARQERDRAVHSQVLREVIKTRYGFHLVAVDQRIPGETLPFEAAREQIAELLKASVEERALRQYVSILAGQAELTGIDLQIADSPLVQ